MANEHLHEFRFERDELIRAVAENAAPPSYVSILDAQPDGRAPAQRAAGRETARRSGLEELAVQPAFLRITTQDTALLRASTCVTAASTPVRRPTTRRRPSRSSGGTFNSSNISVE